MRRKILKKYAIIFILSLITTQVMAQDEDCKQWEVLIDVGYQFRDTPYNEGYSYPKIRKQSQWQSQLQ